MIKGQGHDVRGRGQGSQKCGGTIASVQQGILCQSSFVNVNYQFIWRITANASNAILI